MNINLKNELTPVGVDAFVMRRFNMSRIFSYKDGMKRKRFSNKASRLETAVNEFINEAYGLCQRCKDLSLK